MSGHPTRRLFLMLVAGLAITPAIALADDWKLLGKRMVGIALDRDTIPVTLLQGTFRHIKLRVKDNNVFVRSVVVTYGTGISDNIPVNAQIRAGDESHPLDLRGGDRVIKRVTIYYRPTNNSNVKATVELWGLRS